MNALSPVLADLADDISAVMSGSALNALIAERVKQITRFGSAHDREHVPAELIAASNCYALTAHDQLSGATSYDPNDVPAEWPWEDAAWKCRDPRTNLIKAGALLWAAVDLIDQRLPAESSPFPPAPLPIARGDEPDPHFTPITREHFASGKPDEGPWLVRDEAGNRAAARWTGTMWAYVTPDGSATEQLGFEPTRFLPSHHARDGFVVEPVA